MKIFIMGLTFCLLALLALLVFNDARGDQKPEQYLKAVAIEQGEVVTNDDGKVWGVRFSHTFPVNEIGVVRFVGYVLVYGELTEAAATRDKFPSTKYLMIKRFEEATWKGKTEGIFEKFIDFGPDFIIDEASATGPRGFLVEISSKVATKYFQERRYPELKEFIEKGYVHKRIKRKGKGYDS